MDCYFIWLVLQHFQPSYLVSLEMSMQNPNSTLSAELAYHISSYSFRGNYSFLNLDIQRSQCISSKITVHTCAETIQGRKLFKGRNYMRKCGIQRQWTLFFLFPSEFEAHIKPVCWPIPNNIGGSISPSKTFFWLLVSRRCEV